jgi:hypothetical protein
MSYFKCLSNIFLAFDRVCAGWNGQDASERTARAVARKLTSVLDTGLHCPQEALSGAASQVDEHTE